jgi:hypothetical protein
VDESLIDNTESLRAREMIKRIPRSQDAPVNARVAPAALAFAAGTIEGNE